MHRRFITFPSWLLLSLVGSGLCALTLLLLHRGSLLASPQVQASTLHEAPAPSPTPEFGSRHQLSYEQWVLLLGREAKVAAEKHPANLMILAGDSLSLWFPQELLPPEATWLNQGISGETSYGLLRRVKLLDQTQPETVFIMIGINDLIRGVRTATLLANQQEIIRHLKLAHPTARIVVQSILPHGGGHIEQQYQRAATPGQQRPVWVDRLAAVPNAQIRELNRKLARIAELEKVEYLDVHSSFIDDAGDLAQELSTDGLHLSVKGYQVWRSLLAEFNRTSISSTSISPTPISPTPISPTPTASNGSAD